MELNIQVKGKKQKKEKKSKKKTQKKRIFRPCGQIGIYREREGQKEENGKIVFLALSFFYFLLTKENQI